MGIFLRQLWKQKPDQWGPKSDVTSGLFNSLEKIGIDPSDCALAMPMWNAGDQRDYSKNGLVGVNNGAVYEQNSLKFDGSLSHISFSYSNNLHILDDITLFTKVNITSFVDYAPMIGHFIAGETSDTNGCYVLETYNGNDLLIGHEYGAGSNQFYTPQCNLKTNTDYILCVARNTQDKTWSLYIDGMFFGAYHYDYQADGGTSGTLHIGKNNNSYYKGNIYCENIFHTVLSSDQIAALSDNPYQPWQPYSPVVYSGLLTAVPGTIIVSLSNLSLTSDINKQIQRDIASSLINQSGTSSIDQQITRDLFTNLLNASSINTIDATLLRDFIVNLSDQSGTTSIDIQRLIDLSCNLLNQSLTSDIAIQISGLISLIANLNNQSLTSTITHTTQRDLIVSFLDQSDTTDISISISGIINLIVNLADQSGTTNIDIKLLRDLIVNLSDQSGTTSIDILLANLINLIANLSNQSQITDIDIQTIRDFFVNINSQSQITNVDINILRDLTINLLNQSGTSDSVLIILGALSLLPSDVLSIEIFQNLLETIITQDKTDIKIN